MSGAEAIAPGPSFDRYARIVCRAMGVSMGLVSIARDDCQVFLGHDGLPEPHASSVGVPLAESLCQYVIHGGAPMVVEDLRTDARLVQHLGLTEEGVISYAGWPLTDHEDRVIGSLCAMHDEPRQWREDDLECLRDLAAACSAEFAQREFLRMAVWEGTNALRLVERDRLVLALSEALAVPTTLVEIAREIDRIASQQLGCQRAALWLLPREPRHGRDEPSGQPDAVRSLDMVLIPGDEDASVAQHAVLTASVDNPVGDACLKQQPRYFVTREDQQVEYPQFYITETFGDARAFLPLTLGGAAMGILVIGWPGRREFDTGDRVTLSALATYAAQAVQRGMLIQEQLDTSLALQQAMFTELPTPAGLELTARYRPASTREHVGGDWYDALVLPSGSTVMACGDVVGHDIAAAAAMGQMRSVLRSFAWAIDDGPANTVNQLDLALPSLGIQAMATLVYARIDVPEVPGAQWGVRWTSAGHPPPILLEPDGLARPLEPEEQDLMLGVLPEQPRHVEGVEVDPGSILMFYTDGLIERRGESLDAGIQRLCKVLSAGADLSLDDAVDRVLAELLPEHLGDDVAVIAVRFGNA